MKKKITYTILLVVLTIAGCGDTVAKQYATRAQAEADRLFERGWLPSLIPMSASEITTSNDLDKNTSEGAFKYDIKETNEFLKNLKTYSGQKLPRPHWQTNINEQKMKGYDVFEYTVDRSVWIFCVNVRTGHVQYVMWLS